jgi:hypothetical protein
VPALYVLRSLWRRGLWNSLMLAWTEWKQERKSGLHTRGFRHSGSAVNLHYQGAPYLPLTRILTETFTLSGNILFVDFGSGMGRVLFVAETCGFTELTGIELNAGLFKMAEENLTKFRHNSIANFSFQNKNVLDFDFPDHPAVYFLFNPFDENVLQNLLGNYQRNNHSWFVYMNPVHAKVFLENGFELVKDIYTSRYCEALIFRK